MRFTIAFTLALTCAFESRSMNAADIVTWGTPTTIKGDSGVITTGTLLYACNFGGASVQSKTVNGVTFSPFSITGSNVQTVTIVDR